MLAVLVTTLARAADAPPVWDWSKPHRYLLSTNELVTPPITIALADNIMTKLGDHTVTLVVTCAASGKSAGAGGTTVVCKVDEAALAGSAGDPSEQAKLDESLRQLETWVRGATVDFVQKSDGVMKRVGEVEPGPNAERISEYRMAWLNHELGGCLVALDVAVSVDADEWRTPIVAGTLKVHVVERTDDALTFNGEHGEIAQVSVHFDRKAGAIVKSRVYYAMVGNIATNYWSREYKSELLDAPVVATEP
jgi:hypothetical protein